MDIVQIAARLTIHEFAPEIILANMVAQMPEEDGSAFLIDFLIRSRSGYLTQGDGRGSAVDQMMIEVPRVADSFVEKVRQRAAEIREKQG